MLTSNHPVRANRVIKTHKMIYNIGLYMVGFIIIGGEWFCMWQSKTWNGQMTAGLFAMLFLQHNEEHAK